MDWRGEWRCPALTTLALVMAISGPVQGVDVEQQARELEAMLMAPCCFSQQVSVHQSAAAEEVSEDLRKRLNAGETRDQILQAYVARYGKRILAQPPAEGFDRLLYLFPPLGLVLTAALVVMIVRRFTSRDPSEAKGPCCPGLPVEERYNADLDEQLRDLD